MTGTRGQTLAAYITVLYKRPALLTVAVFRMPLHMMHFFHKMCMGTGGMRAFLVIMMSIAVLVMVFLLMAVTFMPMIVAAAAGVAVLVMVFMFMAVTFMSMSVATTAGITVLVMMLLLMTIFFLFHNTISLLHSFLKGKVRILHFFKNSIQGIPADYACSDSLFFRVNHMDHGLFQNIHDVFVIQ